VLLTFEFTQRLGTADTEIAQIGLWASVGEDIPVGSDWDPLLADLASFATGAWVAAFDGSTFSSELRFGTVKATHFAVDGKIANEQSHLRTPTWVGSGGNALPWQIAQVIGLYTYTPGTFVSHAGRRRGRVYLPGLATVMLATDGSGTFDVTKATANMTSMKALLKALHDHIVGAHTAFIPMVFSRAASTLYGITDLTTDAKPDTQRRRINRLDMARLTTPYDPT
jgi:hypothetical protein